MYWMIGGGIHGTGEITAQHATLNIKLLSRISLSLDVAITDHPTHSVGVNVTGISSSNLHLGRSTSNTFTGDMVVDGPSNLNLQKTSGAIAIQRRLILRNESNLYIYDGGQLGRQAKVHLDNSKFNLLSANGMHMNEQFHQLVVTGESMIYFWRNFQGVSIYLDDLIVSDASRLLIKSWDDLGKGHLFVRKDSAHLEESLGRIKFDGINGRAGVRIHNGEYWEIGWGDGFSKLPEPSTYGAIFGGVGLGLIAWRQRRRRRCVCQRKSLCAPKLRN